MSESILARLSADYLKLIGVEFVETMFEPADSAEQVKERLADIARRAEAKAMTGVRT